jgi:nitrile hydratase
MNPAHYLATSYYEHWLYMVETLMVENGSITRDELDAEQAKLAKEGA